MTFGIKTGGRQKGTPNKPKAAAAPVGGEAVDAGTSAADAPAFPRYRVVATDRLVPYARNARTHTADQIAKIAASIREYGFTNPVLTDGKRGIVAGHGRVLAAQRLGLRAVPTIELSHLSAVQRRAYVLADNRMAMEAGWDDDLLRAELTDLGDAGFDLALTGFDALELGDLFGAGASVEDEDAEAEAGALDGKACCPACGHEFETVAKAFKLIAARPAKAKGKAGG